jgi:DNA-binding MurR/RpiR family transcriptional regulator
MLIRDLIRQHLPALSPSLQQASRYLIDHPNEIATESMRTIASRGGVPPTTLLRLAQQLGFDGWSAFKESVTRELGLSSDTYGKRAQKLAEQPRDAALIDEIFEVHQQNLTHTRQVGAESLASAARLLEQARQVHITGFRACFPIAFSALYVYRLFRPEVHLIDGQGGSLEMQVRGIASHDALMVISFAPYSREALYVTEQARHSGARIIALTDSLASPLSLQADETVLFSTRSPSFFPSVTAAMAATESLLELLAARAGAEGIARIEAAEAQLQASGAYLPLRQ